MDKSTLTLFTEIQNYQGNEDTLNKLHDIYNQMSKLSEFGEEKDYNRAKKLIDDLNNKTMNFKFLTEGADALNCKRNAFKTLLDEMCGLIGDKVKTMLENGLVVNDGDSYYILALEPDRNIAERALKREHLDRYSVTKMIYREQDYWNEFKFFVEEN